MRRLEPGLIATAIEAVLEAGAIHRASYGRQFEVARKGPIDLVTQVDLEAEACVRRLIEARYPRHAILAEESAGAGTAAPAAGFRWVLDPLDGTTNFAHGLPLFCVSLGLEHDGETVMGAVYDGLRGELFTAERGQGARLNGQPLRVSSAGGLMDALLCTGFPYDVHERLGGLVPLFGAFLGKARAVRRLGSAALDLCYVAAGRLDGFWEAFLHPWDTSAGVLIVEEAGGRVTQFDGAPYRSAHRSLIASNTLLHDELLAVIREHGPGPPA
jgi:myo-inositol-1(or 4)-monophosphatase